MYVEAILWEPFQLFRRILNFFGSIKKAPSLQCWFQSRAQIKISWSQIRRCSVYYSLVTLFFAKKALLKTDRCAGALSWIRNQLLVLHFSGHFHLTASLRRRIMSKYIYSFRVAILVNYTSEFLEIFEAATYI